MVLHESVQHGVGHGLVSYPLVNKCLEMARVVAK